MSRRQSSRSRNSSSAQPRKPFSKRWNWLNRALTRASAAGIASCGYGIEPLETRTMMTTVNAIGQAGNLLFYTGQGQVAQITFQDVDFQVICAFVDPTTGAAVLSDPIAPSTPEPAIGGNIYKIYVTESNADSYITIETLNNLMNQVPTPFAGTIPPLAVTGTGGKPIAMVIPGGTGGILIGAVDPTTKPIPNTPITSLPLTFAPFGGEQIGQSVTPGIEVIPTNPDTGTQNDFGQFFIGGTLTGTAEFGGNLNEFYAGSVLTGDIDGDPAIPNTAPTSLRPAPNNFHVAGDLREFITAGPVGTNAVLTNPVDPSSIQYNSSFDLSVGGKIGEVHINSAFAGTIEAGNSPYISGQLPTPAGVTPLTGLLTDDVETEAPPQAAPDLSFTGGGTDPVTGLTIPPTLNAALFSNNTLAQAQLLGSTPEVDPVSGIPLRDGSGNIIYQASVDGVLDNIGNGAGDNIDTYALPFIAGTTFQANVTVTDPAIPATETNFEAILLVVDPDGRAIASNSRGGGGPIQVTADRPGLYRFEVEVYNLRSILQTDFDYNLTVTNVGNMGIGGIFVRQDYSDIGVDSGIICGNGDLGALDIGDTYTSTTLGPTPLNSSTGTAALPPTHAATSILVAAGDLRVITANSIGTLITASNTIEDGPTLSVPNGSIGLIQAVGTGATNIMEVFSQFDPNSQLLATPVFKTNDLNASAIGGSIQVIDAATTLLTEIATNAGIGTIRAANMATTPPSYIDVNADNKGNDGIIDLIDVSGAFGSQAGGGPEFVTNTGGNIRYLNVGGPITLPTAFGGGLDAPVTYPVGVAGTFTDDSGATFTVTPDGPTALVTINNSNGTTTQQSTGTQITVLSYPVLDKAGLVPISITATTPSNVSAGSMTISGSGVDGPNSEVDVANISITGVGQPIVTSTTNSSTGVVTDVTDASGNPLLTQTVPTGGESGVVSGPLADVTDEFLSITGPAKFNVLNVTASVLPAFVGNSPVEISNTTRGEVVNVKAPAGLGSIVVDGNLGFATPQATAAAVLPRADIADGNTYPFVQQHTGVVIGTGFVISDATPTSAGTTGDILAIDVGGAAGNIEAGGTIQSLITNFAQSSGNKNAVPIQGQINGIVGPVLATRLLSVDVGQGLLPTGTGAVGASGLYATGKIGTITNAGNPNGDIRGNIVSAEDLVIGETVTVGIDAITIHNASIIGSTIATVADAVGQIPQFADSSDLSSGLGLIPTNGTNFAPGSPPPVFDVGPITVSGDGGIIGIQTSTGSIAAVTVTGGGFGILSSDFVGQPTGEIGSMSASGYGIRSTLVRNFGYIGPVSATGNGSMIPVTNYPIDVRPSDIPNTDDPFFGFIPDSQIDINAVLGTSALAPNIPNRTDTGVIEDDTFNGLNDFTSLTAQKARSTLPLVTPGALPEGPVLNVPEIGTVFGNSITFGGAVGNIHINQLTDGLQITAGSLAGLSLSSNVNRVGVSVAGRINALVVHGNFGQFVTDPATGTLIPDSYINAGGPNGTIGSLRVSGNLNANISTSGELGTAVINGDVLGSITVLGRGKGLALGSLHVFGGVRDGSLVLDGNVGSIIVNRTFGTAAGSLTITGNANLISVGANHKLRGLQLALSLNVTGILRSLVVYGSITGSVTTGSDLTKLTVTNDGTTPNAITGNISVGGRFGSANIINGNVTSNIIVSSDVNSFTMTRGNFNAGASLQSQIGAIKKFRTVGGTAYGVFGSLIALNGGNENIDISGNFGDGVNAAQIIADSGTTFRVRGNIESNAMMAVTNALNLLRVDGSIQTGATISAHPLKKQEVSGVNNGTIIAI